MREEDSNWFAKWEEELPSPEELIPLSQSLITPDLAIAFDLRSPTNHDNNGNSGQPLPQTTPPQTNSSAEFAADSAGDEPARALKRPRLVWTPQLHKRFVDAVAHLGIKNAVPKTIMQLMSVDGLTRENVASHLQKYRLYLKRMQSGGGGGGGGGNVGESDHLFASSPVPAHFLHPTARQNSDHYMPSFVPITTLQHHQQQQPPQFLHRQISAVNFTSQGNNNGKAMDQSLFLARQSQQQQPVLIRPSSLHLHSQVANYAENLESGAKTVLTLFPSRED